VADLSRHHRLCCSATLDEIKKHDFVLTSGRYAGALEEEEDGETLCRNDGAVDGAVG